MDTRRIEGKRARAVELLGLVPGETVLDVACGTGPVLRALAQAVGRSGRVIGVEQSPEMLAIARRKVVELRLSNVTLIEAPMEKARIRGPVDAVLFSFAHDVMRSPDALARVFTYTRPAARVVAVGAKLYPWWLAPLNLWLRWRVRNYVSSTEGLDRPWSLLERNCEQFRLVDVSYFGSSYAAAGNLRSIKSVSPALGRSAPPIAQK